jgi:hypothetical protein
MAPSSWMVNAILKGSLCMWKGLRTTPKLHLLADIIPAFLTSVTMFTRLPDLERNFVSNFEAFDIGTNADYYARRFVAQRHGLSDNNVAIAVVSVVMEI